MGDPKPPRTALSDERLEAATRSLALLADGTRLRILVALGEGELDVGTLAERCGSSTTSTSQHLAKLRAVGLVKTRKQGRFVFYRAGGSHVRTLVREALKHADRQLERTR